MDTYTHELMVWRRTSVNMWNQGRPPVPLQRWQGTHKEEIYWFIPIIRGALTAAGIDATKYSGHSFRIGAATTAAECGIEESIIKAIGGNCWKSKGTEPLCFRWCTHKSLFSQFQCYCQFWKPFKLSIFRFKIFSLDWQTDKLTNWQTDKTNFLTPSHMCARVNKIYWQTCSLVNTLIGETTCRF